MRKLFFLLIFLFLCYFGIQAAFVYFGDGHDVFYHVTTEGHTFDIHEVFHANRKDERDNYRFDVTVDGETFYFQTYSDFKKSSEVLKEVLYTKVDDMTCIFPVFKDNTILFDVMCKKKDIVYPLHNLKDKSSLDSFLTGLKKYGYDASWWKEDLKDTKKQDSIVVYPNNLASSQTVGVSSYKGLYRISKEVPFSHVAIYTKDVYQKPLNVIAGNYYFSANYYELNDFTRVYFVPLEGESYANVSIKHTISFDSYIQGVVGSSIYLFDNKNRKQYEINTDSYTVLEVGNQATGIKYYQDGVWSRVDAEKAYKGHLLFGEDYPNDYGATSYDKVVRRGDKTGYYYLFQKDGGKYHVYRADLNHKDYIVYLFDTTSIDRIVYLDGYIYYQDGNSIKYYSDKTGNKTVLENSEFEFNKTLVWGVYESKKK